ncbi:MAG TPA: hypothetical protein DCG34_08855 [Clostridiales bacterium]|nr:hypothetical protein [Clostridiales bacterium]
MNYVIRFTDLLKELNPGIEEPKDKFETVNKAYIHGIKTYGSGSFIEGVVINASAGWYIKQVRK